VILFGERSLRRALSDYVDHLHAERNHQGKGNVLLFPRVNDRQREGPARCRERLGGLPRRSVPFFDGVDAPSDGIEVCHAGDVA
jgi:hypothetical protein